MKIPTPLSPSSPNIINVENNLSTPNKTIQKRELLKGVGVEGEGEENIRSVQQKQKHQRPPQSADSPSPCMNSSKTLAEYEAALRDITERYEAQAMEIAALKAEKPPTSSVVLGRVTEEGGQEEPTMDVAVHQLEPIPSGAPAAAPELKIHRQKVIPRASFILHEASALLAAKAEALEKEETEDDTHQSEVQKELEVSVATLREELVLEREAVKGLRECAFAAQTETSELREFGAQEAEVSLSEEIKRLQSSLSDRDQELADSIQLLGEVRRSMENEYSQLTTIHADKEEELGHLKCKHELKENECALLQEELSSKNEQCKCLLEAQTENMDEIVKLKSTLEKTTSEMTQTLEEINLLKEEVTRLNASHLVLEDSLSIQECELTSKEEKITSIITSLSMLEASLLEKGYILPSESQIEREVISYQETAMSCKEVARFSAFISTIEKKCADSRNRENKERAMREATEEQVCSLGNTLEEVTRERESLQLMAISKDTELLQLREVQSSLEDQLLDCRSSEPNVGEKEKKCDDSCNIGGEATAATERGVTILDLIGNAEMAGMMDELRGELEIERMKCRALEEELHQNHLQLTDSAISDGHSRLSRTEELKTLHVEINELRAKASVEAKAAMRARASDMQVRKFLLNYHCSLSSSPL